MRFRHAQGVFLKMWWVLGVCVRGWFDDAQGIIAYIPLPSPRPYPDLEVPLPLSPAPMLLATGGGSEIPSLSIPCGYTIPGTIGAGAYNGVLLILRVPLLIL